MATLPNDPLFQQQWYLFNTGTNSNGGTAGIDLNIVDDNPDNYDVWDDCTGQGIAVAIIDQGVESTHEDLADNYNSAPAGFPYDPGSGQPQAADDNQGTAVAGIIAGVANNQVGITGVAYNAKITGFRYNDITDTDATVLSNQQFFDVSNNSWGRQNPFDPDFNSEPGKLLEQGISEAATKGREGKGTVFVWSGGNGYEAGVNSNYDNLYNSRYTIAVTAVDANGVFAPYSAQGANLLVSAFGDGNFIAEPLIPGTIVTTDRMGDAGYNATGTPDEVDNVNYTGTFNGTSSAAPMVSGVVALMLEANPDLGYRDVQEILAYSAIQNDPTEVYQNDWRFNAATNWNGGGLHNNHNYGFGLVDAHAAVRLAEIWTMQSTAADSTAGTREQMVENGPATQEIKPIPDGDANGLITTLNIESGLDIDHIEVDLNIEHTAIEDLYISLFSPDGTETILFDGPALKDVNLGGLKIPFADFRSDPNYYTQDPHFLALGQSYQQGINFTFGSTFYWGETGVGDWTLNIVDQGTAGTGTLNSWGLRLFGDTISPDDTYIYTDEFGTVAGSDTLRGTLTDADGIDIINATAITTDIVLDLTPGSTGNTLAGGTLTIDANTTIENALGGDGNDSITGNDANNVIFGGRGADSLMGGAGDDSLFGGSKSILMGGAGSDTYVIDSMTAAGTMITDSEGDADTLTLTGITLSVDDSLPAGAVGLQRQGTNLVIDINADGVFDETDLTVQNFFAANDTVAGTGYIETVGNLTGETILAALTQAQPPAPMAQLSIADVSAAEGSGTLTFTVSLSEASAEKVTLDYTTIDDTVEGAATGGEDYEAASGTLTFEAGQTAQTITVSLINDADVEPDETLTVSLSGAMGAEITTAGATGTITNDDTLIGGTEGDDSLEATSDVTFQGSFGSDIIIGVAGFFSQVSYFSLTIGVFVSLLTGFVLKGENGESGTDTLESIQAIEGSDQADTIVGSDSETAGENLMGNLGADSLDGGAGNDTLDGGMPENDTQVGLDSDTITAGVGDDVVMGCLGGDSIDGGEGADQITYIKSTTNVTIDVTVGTVVVTGFGIDNFTGIEMLEGSNFGDTLIGGGEGVTVTLKGGTGNDSLTGGAGEATLDGGEGDDTLTGGAGNATLMGGTGNDSLTGGAGEATLDGGEGDDTLSGGTGKGMLEGGKGNDSLVAGAGNETLMGGGGNDTYELDTLTGAGTVIEDSEGGGDTLTGFTLDVASLTFAVGFIGVQQVETTLQIDLNASGTFEIENDLSVLNFFSATGIAGVGYIEVIGGIQSSEILTITSTTPTPPPEPTPEPTPTPTPEPTPTPTPEPTPTPTPEPTPTPTPEPTPTPT
ncbi:MAG: S8 family serine peptidase, partial [Oscillatoria princeps RMCB-10]|nr:S8 family serine peptidase [Oscillatoria princeps RMCB-10]